MTELPRRVALIVSLLLTSVGTASAQCAWVSWEEVERLFLDTPRRESKDWKLHVARQTQLQCEEVLTRMWDVTLKQNTPHADRPGIKEVNSAPGFLCLPDNIDPRGPK
jgi:hypothetical protein